MWKYVRWRGVRLHMLGLASLRKDVRWRWHWSAYAIWHHNGPSGLNMWRMRERRECAFHRGGFTRGQSVHVDRDGIETVFTWRVSGSAQLECTEMHACDFTKWELSVGAFQYFCPASCPIGIGGWLVPFTMSQYPEYSLVRLIKPLSIKFVRIARRRGIPRACGIFRGSGVIRNCGSKCNLKHHGAMQQDRNTNERAHSPPFPRQCPVSQRVHVKVSAASAYRLDWT